MKLQIAGTLFWMNNTYLLVNPNPVLEKRHWLSDNMREFIVCQENGRVFNIIVTPPFAVSYLRMGETIEVDAEIKEVELDEMQKITHELFQSVNTN